LERHRAFMECFHQILFLLRDFISSQFFTWCSASILTVLRHVILGLPFILYPCRFHSRAFFAILSLSCLNMWLIHFHFR
jgi:hypothetical protein